MINFRKDVGLSYYVSPTIVTICQPCRHSMAANRLFHSGRTVCVRYFTVVFIS